MGKRRKASVDESALPPEERERRRVQRERRALALRQRAAGTKYTPLRIARVQPWRKKEEGGVGWTGAIGEEGRVRARETKEKERAARNERRRDARRARCPYDVVVIPIAWRKKERESTSVSDAARAVHAAVEAGGLRSTLDEDTELAPGQKYRKYEEMGVKVRLEVGPSEAAAGGLACVLARTTTPGEMADKSKVESSDGPDALLAAVRAALEAGGGGGGGGEGSGGGGGSGDATAAATPVPDVEIDYNAL